MHGYNILPGSQPLALIYRIYYKVTGTNMNFQALSKSPKNQTLLIQSHTSNVNVTVPQMIRWSNVKLPQDWYLTTECPPKPIQRSLNYLNYIQPYLDGTVKISFDRPVKSTVQSEQLPTPGHSFKIPARHSFAESSSITERDLEADKP